MTHKAVSAVLVGAAIVLLAVNAQPTSAALPRQSATATPTPVSWPSDRDALVAVAERTMAMDLSAWDWDTATALHGLMAAAGATGDSRYADHVAQVLAPYVDTALPPVTHPNHVAGGLALLDLYEQTGDARYLQSALRLGEAALALPRLGPEAGGAFAHAPDQAWVDTIYMTVPFLVRLGAVTGEASWSNEAARQYLAHAVLLQEPSGAFRHGWDAAGGRIGALWLRGNGWAAAGAADLLRYLPDDHPDRPAIVRAQRRQLAALFALQAESGRWATVIDHFDYYEETSGGAAVTYALGSSLAAGLVGSDYAPAFARARAGLSARVDESGVVRGVSVGTGPQESPAEYNAMAVDQVQPWGQGLALLALAQPGAGFALSASPSTVVLAPGQSTRVALQPLTSWGNALPLDWQIVSSPPEISSELLDEGAGHARLVVSAAGAGGGGRLRVRVAGVAATYSATVEVKVLVAERPARIWLPLAARGGLAAAREISPLPWADPATGWSGETLGVGPWGVLMKEQGDVARTLRPALTEGGGLGVWDPRHPRGFVTEFGERAVIVDATAAGLDLGATGNHLRALARGDGPVDGGAELRALARWDGPVDGGAWRSELAQEGASVELPAAAPDGRRLSAFVTQPCRDLHCRSVQIADPPAGTWSGTGFDRPSALPDWHPVADLLAVITLEEPDNAAETALVWDLGSELPYEAASVRVTHAPPRWSPDGLWLAVAQAEGVTVVDRFGAARVRVKTNSAPSGVDWSGDGGAVIYAAADRPGAVPTLHQAPVRLPRLERPFPPPWLAGQIADALDAFVAAHPLEGVFPSYAASPGRDAALEAVESACTDWPDLPASFGAGVHPHACREWVAGYLALFHAVGATRAGAPDAGGAAFGFDRASHQEWSRAFLTVGLSLLGDFVYGPEDRPGRGYRDTRAAVWQNPQRAVDLLLAADLLKRQDALPDEMGADTLELGSAVARAWDAEWWSAGIAPSDGVTMTTAVSPTMALSGRQVGATEAHYFEWDADKGNTPAEEVAWLGAGTMVAARIAGATDGRAPKIEERARHFASFAVAMERPDPERGGQVTTLNTERVPGRLGQRTYAIENHFADTPAIPYVGSTWHSLEVAMLAGGGPQGGFWPELAPDDASWRALWGSAEETIRSGDGDLLVDFGTAQFRLDQFPEWIGACGDVGAGRPYVASDGPERQALSEIGHGPGMDMLASGVGIMRVADSKSDEAVYLAWQERTRDVLQALTARPPDPAWSRCKTAAYVSTNPAYHTSRILAGYLVPLLTASDYVVTSW